MKPKPKPGVLEQERRRQAALTPEQKEAERRHAARLTQPLKAVRRR